MEQTVSSESLPPHDSSWRFWWLALLAGAAAFVSAPLWSSRVLSTQAEDLANHVRHVYECKLAFEEGQVPPLVAPALNGAARIPLFQYYSGTAYLLPGWLCWLGLNPLASLALAVALLSFLAGVSTCACCWILTRNQLPSLVAALAFQLFPFGGVDLHNRGAFPEWAALQCLPVVLLASLAVARSHACSGAAFTFLCGLAWAYFIPLHPVQTLYAGSIVLFLAFIHCHFQGDGWRADGRLLLGWLTGCMLSAWFWLPVVRDLASLRITGHFVILNSHFTWARVLWPWFQAASEIQGWAVQVGLAFAIAAVLTAIVRPSLRRAQWWAAIGLLALLIVLVEGHKWPLLEPVLRGLQWNYRLLVSCALLGAISLAQAIGLVGRWLPTRQWTLGVQCAALLAIVITSVPYYRPTSVGIRGEDHRYAVADVLADDFRSPNSSYYSFVGTDMRDLNWVDNGALVLGRDLPIPMEGKPFEFRIELAPESGERKVVARIKGQSPAIIASQNDNGKTILRGVLLPPIGYGADPSANVRFEPIPAPEPIQVVDFAVKALGGGDEAWFRPAAIASRNGSTLSAIVDRGGLYQLPIHYAPDTTVLVNGARAQHASRDRYLLIVPLRAGLNEISVSARANGWALAMAGLTLLAWTAVACRLAFGWLMGPSASLSREEEEAILRGLSTAPRHSGFLNTSSPYSS